jgi:hypothetical protein
VQHKAAWNFARLGSNRLRELVRPGGTNRLRELLRLYACRDAVAPIDEDAFGTRASELIARARGEPRTEAAEIANFSDTHKSDQAFSVAPISGVGGSGQIFASGFGTPSVGEH